MPVMSTDTDTRYVLRCWGVATQGKEDAHELDGLYLQDYDLDAFDGRGTATWTPYPTRALTWPSAADAMKAWRTVSTTRPVREDGQPNRPLTAFHVEITSL